MIRRAWLMARKDLRRAWRAPLGISLLLAFPLMFAGLLALAFGGGQGFSKVQLLVEDRDEGLAASALMMALQSEQLTSYFDVRTVDGDGRDRMERGEASALLVIPEDFTEAVLDGSPARLQLVRNPSQQILPEIAEQTLQVLVEVIDSATRVLREPLARIADWTEQGAAEPSDVEVAAIAVMMRGQIVAAGPLVFPPAIVLDASGGDDSAEGSGGESTMSVIFLFVLPGAAVFSLFLLAESAMRDILAEKDAGTLRRQLSGPLGAGTVVLGKTLYTALLSLISVAILSAIGWGFSSRPIDPVAFLLLCAAVVLMVTGTAALTYGLARSERQGSTVGTAIFLLLGFTGGSFVSVDNLPAVLRGLTPFNPFFWANDSFRQLLQDGAGSVAILPRLGLLVLFGALGLMLGSALLRRRISVGAAG